MIRESEELGGPPPFDLASERMVIVPRDGEGELLRDDFKNALSVAINKSLGAV